MKINKILAAGIAATLAVTSVGAVVASAETKTFDMAKTIGTEKVTYRVAYFTDNTSIVPAAAAQGADPNPLITAEGLISIGDGSTEWDVDGAQMKVTGTRNGSTNTVTETYNFADLDGDGVFTMALKTGIVTEAGQVNLNSYDAVTGVEIWATVKATRLAEGEVTYGLYNGKWDDAAGAMTSNSDIVDIVRLRYTADNKKGSQYAVDANDNCEKIYANLGISKPDGAGAWYNGTVETKDMLAFLEKTTEDGTIYRQDVKLLSKAGAWTADTAHILGTDEDGNQTFNDGHEGTAPFWFGGLASWVADFFNKQNNGKIIFNFTDKAASSSGWKNGGIPSTEVGLKSAVAGTSMGLFINYAQSTGSLQSLGVAEGTAITFDISEILQDMGGLTKGNISDIYYGMNKGIDYQNKDYGSVHAAAKAEDVDRLPDGKWYVSTTDSNTNGVKTAIGYLVESVTLSYDDAAAAAADADVDEDDADVEDDADDDVEDDVADDADDDEEDDDADDAELTDDTDDDDDVANDEDINTPADDDANPGTGVALAVIPALVAGAAVVVSKKRK